MTLPISAMRYVHPTKFFVEDKLARLIYDKNSTANLTEAQSLPSFTAS
jgi:hypothetical protein